MVQLPVVIKVNSPPLVIVHTPVVDEVKLAVKLELALAVNVGAVPKLCAPGLANVIVCDPIGVTLLEALDTALAPAELVAVTLKLYAVPLVRPVTVKGEAAPLAVKPPGLAVAV
jgi:hypothetical protein